MGTLVVAISSFYFGATSTVSAANAARAMPSEPVLRIDAIRPTEGKHGEELEVEIIGTGLNGVNIVQLSRDYDSISAISSAVEGSTKIRSKFRLDRNASDERWDIVVVLKDTNRDRLPKVFKIVAT